MSAKTVVTFCLLYASLPLTFGLHEIVNRTQNICSQSCATNLTFHNEGWSDLFCDKECSVQHCTKGCLLYPGALHESCNKVCMSSYQEVSIVTEQQRPIFDEIRNCVQGCIYALHLHAGYWKTSTELNPLATPVLVESSLGSSSLTLEWDTPFMNNVLYKVHKIIVGLENKWHLHEDAEFLHDSWINITNLQPYASYKFKVLVLLSSFHEPIIESPETLEIQTRPRGVPSTPPTITSAATPSPWVISISWTAPPFTNGKILKYRIYARSVNQPRLNMTAVDVPSSDTSCVLRRLEPSQQYIVSVSAWNSEGEGRRSNITVTTPSPQTPSVDETAYLIFGSANKIIKRSIHAIVQDAPWSSENDSKVLSDHTREPENVICALQGANVKGISLHVRRQLIMATDSSGNLTLISLADNSVRSRRYSTIRDPGPISVDWLADRAFIGTSDGIYSCPLDTDLCVVAVQGLPGVAVDVKVDPINGFLYYIINGEEGAGLYRVDLGNLWASDELPQRPLFPNSERIIVRINMIDFNNVQQYALSSPDMKLMVASLDGSGLQNLVEKNGQVFGQVSSMVFYNQSFIWTDMKSMYIEEYRPDSKTFLHKDLQFLTPPYTNLNLLHSTAQPVPVPLSHPESIEAFFSRDRAAVSWKPPPLLPYQGSGAWRNWTYELQMSKINERGVLLDNPYRYSVSGLSFSVNGLDPDTSYSIKIRARSGMFSGPWSNNFIGRTLKHDGLKVLMAIAGGQVIEKDLSQETEKSLFNVSSDVTDISSHNDVLLLVTSYGSLLVYNQTSLEEQPANMIHSADSVAYDWLGQKMYWSELGSGIIYRSSLSENIPEHILQSPAKDIAIDSLNGRMYWTTLYTIETSHLNGDNQQEIFSLSLITGRHMVSLAIDFDSQKVLWCEKDYKSQQLFMMDMIPMNGFRELPTLPIKRGELKSISSTSDLRFFSHHLFWLTEQNSLAIGDSQCSNTVNVNSYAPLTSFTISHPSLSPNPTNVPSSNIKVIPNKIQPKDIQTVGSWSSFNLTWPEPAEVTYGTVFYKLFVEVGNMSQHITTSEHFFEMSGYPPYTQIQVYIQPYTYWGYSAPTTVSVRTPMSKPTAVTFPEVTIIHHKNATALQQTLAADFRWMSPKSTNGIISHHLLTYWVGNDPTTEKTIVRLAGTTHHFVVSPLLTPKTYNFQVTACTEVGCGPDSSIKTLATNGQEPAPALLVASKQSIGILEMEKEQNSSVIRSDVTPKAISFLAHDETRVFCLDESNTVYESIGSSIQKLVELNRTGQDLTIDWISRTLYIIESESLNHSTIMQYNMGTQEYKVLLSRHSYIGSVVSDPYNSAIIWVEVTPEGQGQILSADVITREVDLVLGNNGSHSEKNLCTCPPDLNVVPVIAMDYKSHDGATEIIFADKVTAAVYSSDLSGCQCTRIIQPTPSERFGLPPNLLAVDHQRVSWYNETEGRLYSASKTTGEMLFTQLISGIKDILAFGSHLQPFPDSQCLDPGAYNSTVEEIFVGNTSVQLKLFAPVRPLACLGISVPQEKYTVYYRKIMSLKTGATPKDCSADLSACEKQIFHNTAVNIENLEPYTQYLFQVAVSNYYTEYLSEVLSSPLLLSTKFGVPQAARALKANILTPEMITISFQPPLKFNGPPEQISYVIQVSTVTNGGHFQREMEQVINTGVTQPLINTDLDKLKPGQLYSIVIETCTANKTMCSTTDAIKCKTFQTPGDISFVNATAHSVEILWRSPPDNSISRHQIVYAEVKSGLLKWNTRVGLPVATENFTEYREAVTELEPFTLYAFRIHAFYRAKPIGKAHYMWPSEEMRFMHRTLAFQPNQPSSPVVNHLTSGAYEVQWEKPDDNGAPISNYILEYRNVEDGIWESVYNGSEESWLIETSRMKHGKSYIFRVAAINSEGMGAYSDNSSVFSTPFAIESNLASHITIGVVTGLIALVIIITIAVVYVLRKRQQKIKIQQFIIHGPDTELATLRELPHTAFQQSNTLYAINIPCTDEEIALLPHFSRNQLVLTMFLGSGAFGEVFEGLAKNILGDGSGETKCAVKTLRKSASDHEKEEFLKEALLMKNFKHEHILSLLGVCLDNDPQFIIMELMEGGDLLSFLRSCRATSTTPAKLILPDLVKICLHVAKGCQYLEDMHFVHRDLAARNCLVSTKLPADMIVKIGDFGLARDIYKNDYYRKEGEGLLPVRWMSPESLVDGFFTTQSDIWAFGVLMWEVVTLGQQPYPARTNIEVLHFVRDQGKLERPDKCADEMYSLMSKCWNFHPDNRPSFANLVKSLEMCKEKCQQMTIAEIAQYSPAFIDGGGSVRLTHSGKRRRLNDLLGSSDPPEKLVVDLTKMRGKRTHSLEDSKHSSQYSPSVFSSRDHFPAAGEYDHNGYLEPRGAKGGGRYLELMNIAPELLHLRDPHGNPLICGNGSAFMPVHVTHKGYHPANISYTLLTPEEDADDAHCQKGASSASDSDAYSVENRKSYSQSPTENPYRLVSVEEMQDKGSPKYTGRCPENLQYPQSSWSPPAAVMVKLPPPRKFSDQDLYSSTVPFRQHQHQPVRSPQDHRYTSVECNSNRSNIDHRSFDSGQAHLHDNGINRTVRQRNDPGIINKQGKPRLNNPPPLKYPASVENDNYKLSSIKDNWVNNLDDVFVDNSASSDYSPQQGHGHHSSKSRGQVYPESSSALLGYETNQISLV